MDDRRRRGGRWREGRPEDRRGRESGRPRGRPGPVDRPVGEGPPRGPGRAYEGRGRGERPRDRPGVGRPERRRHEGRAPDRGRPGARPRPFAPPPEERPARAMLARGLAGDVGLDGLLRVALEPIDLHLAEVLQGGRGAEVMHPRGARVGRVREVVGTLQHPVAIVELDADARKAAMELRGRELYIF